MHYYITAWIVGSTIVCLATLWWGFKLIVARKKYVGVCLLGVSVVAFFFNPVANVFMTENWNHQCCVAALEKAKAANYIGSGSKVVRKDYGEPYRIQRSPSVEYWAYRTGPWQIFYPDEFLGFEVKDDKITNVYIEVD